VLFIIAAVTIDALMPQEWLKTERLGLAALAAAAIAIVLYRRYHFSRKSIPQK
jgi:hypothetical protein